MRIAIVPSFIAPVVAGRCFGGAEVAALALAEALVRAGDEVSLVGIAGSAATGARWIEAPSTPAFVPGEEVSDDPTPFESLFVKLRTFDCVHTHLNDPGALRALTELARHTRVVATLHLSAVFPATTRAVQGAIDSSAQICWVAPSRFAAASYGRGPAIHVVPNGIDAQAGPWSARATDARVAWAGRKVPEKGLDLAIAAAQRAGRMIEVAGAGPLHTQDGVRDHGLLPRDEVRAMFARASAVLVTSSIAEAHPLVAIEALLAGTPVVGFDVGGLCEIVEPSTGRLVAPGDVDALIRALDEVSHVSRVHCRARAEARFSESQLVANYRTLYAARS